MSLRDYVRVFVLDCVNVLVYDRLRECLSVCDYVYECVSVFEYVSMCDCVYMCV